MLSLRPYLLLCLLVLVTTSCNSQPSEFVAVNLVGYETDELKQAFAVNAPADSFEVIHTDTDEVVFSASPLYTKQPDSAAGDALTVLDFTPLRDAGTYFIRLKNHPEIQSDIFQIHNNIYDSVTTAAFQSYYYHRCGTAVDNGEQWSYQACHLDDAPFYENPDLHSDVTGGWHDAGDYNKFSVNTALSAALLLYTYELNPEAFTDGQLKIPESDNEIPDVLDEVKWALDWLLKMQREDGAIYHKVSQKKWTGEFMPDEDPNTRYIFEVSSSSTAAFAAAAALASRLFKKHDSDYARSLEDAALASWRFLEKNPQMIPDGGFQNPPDVRGGEYRDENDSDERLWAAAELMKLTGNELFGQYFVNQYQRMQIYSIEPISWKNFHSLALNAFLDAENVQGTEQIKSDIRNKLMRHADAILAIQEQNNYANLNALNEYYWGSNSVGLAYAYDLIQAYEISRDRKYLDAARNQMHFILGRNPFNRSQVTNIGSRSSQHPYHQLSELDGVDEPIPGMLVGGPNNYLYLNDEVISPYPAKNYEDRFKNYLVNETAINYTAILAYVSGYLMVSDK